ncbi:hypothetical protein [Rosistilla oblonga]|uniref:hypothetical protein n=1 Tax=Rosistilla oblonga TaxID=2527990 RepID=UPI003A971141
MTEREPEFDFTLLLDGADTITPSLEDSLFQAGCDDATISLRFGRIYLTFSRSAPSLKDAILSAIKSVRDSGIPATVLRVDTCELVTQADIARRIDRSRQLVNQYINGSRGPGGFPAPACNITDGALLWNWCEVAHWLWENNFIKKSDLKDAQDLTIINSVLELEHQRQRSPDLTKEIITALC